MADAEGNARRGATEAPAQAAVPGAAPRRIRPPSSADWAAEIAAAEEKQKQLGKSAGRGSDFLVLNEPLARTGNTGAQLLPDFDRSPGALARRY